MTWRAESTDCLDKAIEDEIRRELDSFDLQTDEIDAADQDSYFPVTQESDSALEDVDIVDDVVKQYASRLEQRTSLFEKELLECNDLLDAAKNHANVNGLSDSWKLVPVHEASQPPNAFESVHEILSLLDDDTSSSEDGFTAIEWLPSYREPSSPAPPMLETVPGFGLDEVAPPPVPTVPGSMEQTSGAGDGKLGCVQGTQEQQSQCEQRSDSPAAAAIAAAVPLGMTTVAEQQQQRVAASAASRERYKQAAARDEQNHEELRRKLLAADEEQERGRAERTAKLQRDAELLKRRVEDQEAQLRKEVELEHTQLSTLAAELKEQIQKIDTQLHEEKAGLRNAILAQQLRQQQIQHQAAVTVQAAYRGHRARKTHGATLRERLGARHDEAVARRIQELEAVRQAAEQRRQEAEEEERHIAQKRAQEEEERRRMAAEEEEERRRRAAQELANRKAEEEERRRQKEAERLARRAEKERLKKMAEEEALRKAREKAAEDEERRRRAAEAAAAERERKAKQEEERKLRRQKEAEDYERRLKEEAAATAAAAAAAAAAADGQQAAAHWRPQDMASGKVTHEQTRQAQHDDRTLATAAEAPSSVQSAQAESTQGRAAAAAEHALGNGSATTTDAAASALAAAGAAFSRTTTEAKPLLPPSRSDSYQTLAAASEPASASDHDQHGSSRNGTDVMPSTGLASAAEAAAALQAAQLASSAAAAAKQHSEKRLAEMQLLKERMEKLQSNSAFSSRGAGNDASRLPAAAVPATTAAAAIVSSGSSKAGVAIRASDASTVVSLDMSFIGSKMEERRLRWMKECTPWSSVHVEAVNRKAPPQPKKCTSKKIDTAREALPESTVLAAAGNGIVSLQQLQAVQLEDLPGYSLSTLSTCRHLQAVVVRRCALISLDDLLDSPCTAGLLLLDCQANNMEKLPVGCFDSLTVLDLSSNHVTSMAGLEGCHALRLLSLAKNKLTRIAGLAHLRSLHTLDLSHNQLISTKGVGEAVALQTLDVSHNHLSAVDDVDKLCLLESLCAQGNNIRDIPRLANAVLLRELQLSDNSIATLGSLAHSWLPSLNYLAISHNSLSALVPLHGCPLLKRINLCHNQLVDVHNVADSLKFCVNLEELLLDGTPAACRANYRVQLLGLLPRLRLLDGVTSNAAVGELYPSDFLRACAARQRQAENLCTEWSEQTRIPADRKLNGMEIMRVCAAHTSYFEQSSSYAQDSRSMHEYGELGVTDGSVPPGQGHSHATAASSSTAAHGRAVAVAAAGTSDAALPTASAHPVAAAADGGSMASAAKYPLRTHGPASGSTTGVVRDIANDVSVSSSSSSVRPRATIDGLQSSSNSAAGSGKPTSSIRASHDSGLLNDLSDDSDEISAVGSANRTLRHVLSKVVVSTSAAASSTNRTGVSSKPPEAASAAATVESKEAFEERLRAALENTSRRLLQSDGFSHAAVAAAAVQRSALPLKPEAHGTAAAHSGASPGASVPTTVNRAGPGASQQLVAGAGGEAAATRIQAVWRGYALRKRLHSALRHARVDVSDAEDFSDYGEVDVTAFDLEEARLDENWLPSQTPQLPRSYAALPSRSGFVDGGGRAAAAAAADILTIPSHATREPHPPVQPRHAWRSQSSTSKASAAFDGRHSATPDPSPPTPALSGGQSHRSALSRKEEMLAEEWGFKDQRTAELMVQRAKKLKYDAIKKKKLRKLDPQQKLAFLRRLEESAGPPAVHVPAKRAPPKKEYFEAVEAEARQRQMEQRAEEAAKEQRLYEWVHTQVGNHFDDDDAAAAAAVAAGATGRRRVPPADGLLSRHQNATGQDSLPYIERRLIEGGRAQLVASPLDVQSVDSAREHGEQQQQQHYKRLSEADLSKDGTQLPPIKTSSAPSNATKKERISFRDQKVDLGPGWGGGRKRNSQR